MTGLLQVFQEAKQTENCYEAHSNKIESYFSFLKK